MGAGAEARADESETGLKEGDFSRAGSGTDNAADGAGNAGTSVRPRALGPAPGAGAAAGAAEALHWKRKDQSCPLLQGG